MTMTVKQNYTASIESIVYSDDGMLKNAPCELDEWYGNEICEMISIDEIINTCKLPDGEYQLKIILEKID